MFRFAVLLGNPTYARPAEPFACSGSPITGRMADSAPDGLRSRTKATRCAGRALHGQRAVGLGSGSRFSPDRRTAGNHAPEQCKPGGGSPACGSAWDSDGPSQTECCSLGCMHPSLGARSLSFYRCGGTTLATLPALSLPGRRPRRRAHVCLAAAGRVRGRVRSACTRPPGPCLRS